MQEAYGLWRQAVRAAYERHDPSEQLPLLERAVDLDPDAPSYRFMAGILRVRGGDWAEAFLHLQAGRDLPQSAFRKGQFLLWGARCLEQLERREEATRWRDALLGLSGRHLKGLMELARSDADQPLSARRLRHLTYSLDLVDAQA